MTARRKSRKMQYKKYHNAAKAVVFVLQLLLTVLIAIVFINEEPWYLLPLFLIKELLYFFGVNTVAYIIEEIKHVKHLHDKV